MPTTFNHLGSNHVRFRQGWNDAYNIQSSGGDDGRFRHHNIQSSGSDNVRFRHDSNNANIIQSSGSC